jgi:hypothetical protein
MSATGPLSGWGVFGSAILSIPPPISDPFGSSEPGLSSGQPRSSSVREWSSPGGSAENGSTPGCWRWRRSPISSFSGPCWFSSPSAMPGMRSGISFRHDMASFSHSSARPRQVARICSGSTSGWCLMPRISCSCLSGSPSGGERLARIMHETLSRDRGDGRATGQPQGLGPEAYLSVRRKVSLS